MITFTPLTWRAGRVRIAIAVAAAMLCGASGTAAASDLCIAMSGSSGQIAGIQDQSARQQAELAQAREVVATLTATDAMRVTLVAAKSLPQPQGKAIYVRDRSSLIFLASNFPNLPAQKAYELWLIPMSGAPIKPWVEVVTLHPDVISENFSEDIFALDLGPLADGNPNVPAVYRDPEHFFRASYLTKGLRSLLEDVLSRLSGGAGNRVLKLVTRD